MAWLQTIPIAKIVYSVLLAGLIIFSAKELFGIWWDKNLYIGNFQYFSDGKSDENQARAFPAHVLGQHQLLRSALVAENLKRDRERKASAPAEAEIFRGLPSGLPEFARWQSAFTNVELKIQGFDLSKLFGTLQSWISPPQEINGFVEKSDNTTRATVNWPVRALKNGTVISTPFDTGYLSGESAVALALAASVAWLHAAEADEDFARIPREVFVAWVLAWWDYRFVASRRAVKIPVSDEDKVRWKQARQLVDTVIESAPTYPEIWRLRADIIDATLEAKTPEEIETAAEDRRKYDGARRQAPIIAAVAALKLQTGELQKALATQRELLEKIEATGESRMVRPGQQIWARKTSEKDPSSRVAVAATAIVRDKDGKRKILLPDFALLDLSLDGETEYRLTPEGPVISRAGKRDLAYPKGQGSVVGRGVVLAELENDVAALKVPVNSPSDIAGVARLPPLGSVLSILTLRKRGSAKIASIEDDLLVTVDSHITAPGDAGAPVLDERGNLVAMGHSVASNVSRFLSVNWVFDQQGVQLLR